MKSMFLDSQIIIQDLLYQTVISLVYTVFDYLVVDTDNQCLKNDQTSDPIFDLIFIGNISIYELEHLLDHWLGIIVPDQFDDDISQRDEKTLLVLGFFVFDRDDVL